MYVMVKSQFGDELLNLGLVRRIVRGVGSICVEFGEGSNYELFRVDKTNVDEAMARFEGAITLGLRSPKTLPVVDLLSLRTDVE